MIVELSPAVYIALCGLVQDALEHPSDASFLLHKAAKELANGKTDDEFAEQPEDVEAPRRAGTAGA